MRIAVVGAGPAGAALSLLLARNGARVMLVERETDFDRVFRGEGLMPLGLEMLQQMGLGEAVAALPGDALDAWDIHLDRTRVLRVEEPSRELGDLALRIVSQPALLSLLTEAAGEHPGFELRTGTTARDLLRRDGRVSGLRVSTPAGEQEVEASLVVGCDGRASLVRKRADLALSLLDESYDVLWFKTALPERLEGSNPVQIFASGAEAALAYRSWDGRWQIAWMLPKGGWRSARESDWLARCASLMPPPLDEHLLSQRDELLGPSLLDVMVGRCARWHAPGVLLLGDAAHPMSPIRAQGINMALRDAVVAANHLVPTLHADALDTGALDAACAAIQREREPEVVTAQTLQHREARGQRWARQQPWLMKPLLALVPWLFRSEAVAGFVQRSWLRQQRPLRMGTQEIRLAV